MRFASILYFYFVFLIYVPYPIYLPNFRVNGSVLTTCHQSCIINEILVNITFPINSTFPEIREAHPSDPQHPLPSEPNYFSDPPSVKNAFRGVWVLDPRECPFPAWRHCEWCHLKDNESLYLPTKFQLDPGFQSKMVRKRARAAGNPQNTYRTNLTMKVYITRACVRVRVCARVCVFVCVRWKEISQERYASIKEVVLFFIKSYCFLSYTLKQSQSDSYRRALADRIP